MNLTSVLSKLKVGELRLLCQEFGKSSIGSKNVLITNLLNTGPSQLGSGKLPSKIEINGQPYRYIFSFGSNNIKQLLNRCREAEEIKKMCCGWRSDLLDIVKPYIRAGIAQDFSRSFFSTSIGWGGAVSTLIPNPGASVKGILIPMPEKFLPCLDKFEGVHIGKYAQHLIDVDIVDANEQPIDKIEAVAYIGNITGKYELPADQVKPTEAYLRAIARTMRDYRSVVGRDPTEPYTIDIRRNRNPEVQETVTLMSDQIDEPETDTPKTDKPKTDKSKSDSSKTDIRKQFMNFQFGDLPIILVSSHGGSASNVNFTDESGKAIELAIRASEKPAGYKGLYSINSDVGANFFTKNLADQLAVDGGKQPYQIKALFPRKVVDADRSLEMAIPLDQTMSAKSTEWNRRIYEMFHQTIKDMITDIRKTNPDQPVVIIDVHRQHSKGDAPLIYIGTKDAPLIVSGGEPGPREDLASLLKGPISQPGYVYQNYTDQKTTVIPIEISSDLIDDKDMRNRISSLLSPSFLQKALPKS